MDNAQAFPKSPTTLPTMTAADRLPVRTDRPDVMAHLQSFMTEQLDLGVRLACSGASVAEMEGFAAQAVSAFARTALTMFFGEACREAMLGDLKQRGLDPIEVRLRTDKRGYWTVHTTFGPVTFPTFSYHEILSSTGGMVFRHPARELFPYHVKCRSTPACLEWEMRLGAQHPFRKAEELFHFFSRGASTVEDTTISRHMLFLSLMIDPTWLYRRPEDIREILKSRATRDKTTGRPLLYVSSDAHALKRYVDDSWVATWKMTNGIRIWCEDKRTGAIIHLGGEFTWGDCRVVAQRFAALMKDGILPDGDDNTEWKDVDAQVVFISDGSEWLVDHIVHQLHDPVVILDPYHLIEWFGPIAKLLFGKGTAAARGFYARLREVLFGKRRADKSKGSKKRKGHKKRRGLKNSHTHDLAWLRRGRPRTISSDFTVETLLELLADLAINEETQVEEWEAREALVQSITKNDFRIDYPTHLARGMQIGSGAMESMHRSGSQLRLKVPGANWLEETSQAVLNFRMLEMCGRWEEFWSQENLVQRISKALDEGMEKYPTKRAA